MYFGNINKEEFLQFALDTKQTIMENGRIFKTSQDGIVYIIGSNFREEIISSKFSTKVEIFGFIFNGKFYSTNYYTRDIDLNFYEELNAFEDKFNKDYEEFIKRFTIDDLAPITEKTVEKNYRDEDFEYYCKYRAREDAEEELFGVKRNYNTEYNNLKFAPIFFDCLHNPEKYDDYIQTAAEKNAHIINYKIKCNAEKEKAVEALKADTDFMYKLNMHKTLESIDSKTVKINCILYGENFELSIARDELMRSIRYSNNISSYSFPKSVRENIEQAAIKAGFKKYEATILFTDIKKITFGKKTIFEQEA